MPDLRKQTNPNAYLGTNDLLRRLDAAIRERDEAQAALASLVSELHEWIDGEWADDDPRGMIVAVDENHNVLTALHEWLSDRCPASTPEQGRDRAHEGGDDE